MDLQFPSFLIGGLTGVLTGLAGLAAYRAATRQNRLSATNVAADWLRDLRAWASEAIDVLAEASYTVRRSDPALLPDEQATLVRCRHRLSALIDRGRLLLPNEREDEYGDHKAEAYKGLRHPALDGLVAAERILGGDANLESFPDRKSALIGVRREFVSIAQAILDPRSVNRTVARILREAHEGRRKDPTMGGLLPDPKNVPSGAEGLLYAASRRHDEAHGRSISRRG